MCNTLLFAAFGLVSLGRAVPHVTKPTHQTEAYVGAGKCVRAAHDPSYNHAHSPVFVQSLHSSSPSSVTFAAGQCLRCREDQRGLCGSAMVECPAEPGKLAMEYLYTTSDCSGPSKVSRLPTRFVHCPGPEYWGLEHLDLERFVYKLQRDHPTYIKSEDMARAAIAEYRRMLKVTQKFPDSRIVPSSLVDLVWHEHIMDTSAYQQDSQRFLGHFLHHVPAFGNDKDLATQAERQQNMMDMHVMFEKYRELFEEDPSTRMWPAAKGVVASRRLRQDGGDNAGFGYAKRKPDCGDDGEGGGEDGGGNAGGGAAASCGGCAGGGCGRRLGEAGQFGREGHHSHPRMVLPEAFGGYMPAPRSVLDSLPQADEGYLCKILPMEGMSMEWTVAGDNIYVKQVLETDESWISMSIGLTCQEPSGASHSDFIVSSFTGNYTGIRDMYKSDAGNDPCLDSLTQCSVNATAGTMDLTNRATTRSKGVSVATFSRKLDTGDWKDFVIADEMKMLLFATDKFRSTSCGVNFFTGEHSCTTGIVNV